MPKFKIALCFLVLSFASLVMSDEPAKKTISETAEHFLQLKLTVEFKETDLSKQSREVQDKIKALAQKLHRLPEKPRKVEEFQSAVRNLGTSYNDVTKAIHDTPENQNLRKKLSINAKARYMASFQVPHSEQMIVSLWILQSALEDFSARLPEGADTEALAKLRSLTRNTEVFIARIKK